MSHPNRISSHVGHFTHSEVPEGRESPVLLAPGSCFYCHTRIGLGLIFDEGGATWVCEACREALEAFDPEDLLIDLGGEG